jgi:hypothetical protein
MVTGLPSASSATLVAGELDLRFVEHSVDGAERLGVIAHQLFSALAAFADQLGTLENCDVFLHRGEANLVMLGQRRRRLLGSQHFSLGQNAA